MRELPKFEMRFEPMTIEHLGLRLYNSLPPVISEFVSNAYDADSPKVEISLPTGKITGKSEVVIRDLGHAMTADEIQEQFLRIGWNRRGKDSKDIYSRSKKRKVTGRKGLGKLSAFGIATEMDVRSIRNGEAICLRLNYDDMQSWMEKHGNARLYQPKVVEQRTGPTKEPEGVEISLRRLHRTNAISEETLRRGLAKRLDFIGGDFQVFVNGVKIKPEDRLSQSDIEQRWDVSELPDGGLVDGKHKLKGWIGFARTSCQSGRGVDIYATGKAVELSSSFGYPSTHAQFARAYLIGQVHADFLDAPGRNGDRVSTARNSVVWESPEGQALEKWGHKALKWAFDQWLAERRRQREDAVTIETGFDKWLESREPRQQRIARRMVKLLVANDDLTAATAKPLLDIVKTSVETYAFRELVDDIEAEGGNTATLLRLFNEWKVIEAREHLKLAYGRMEALDQLERYIDEGALEVKEMQPLLVSNPWIIGPAWTETHIEKRYSDLLKEHCEEPRNTPKRDRRLDIWGVKDGRTVTVVELKHPQKTLSWDDLDQIEQYVRWARTKLKGTGQHAPRYVDGLLVIGQQCDDGAIADKRRSLAGEDIRVETYNDLYIAARAFYDELDRRVQRIAPEYSRQLKKKREAEKLEHTKPSAKKRASAKKKRRARARE